MYTLFDLTDSINAKFCHKLNFVKFTWDNEPMICQAQMSDFFAWHVQLMLNFEGIFVKEAQESFKVDYKNVFVVLGELEYLTVTNLFTE